MAENDGFADMSRMLSDMHIDKNIAADGLGKGAEYFKSELYPTIPYSSGKEADVYGHMRDQLHTETKTHSVDVTFGDAYWWWFVENGTAGKHPQRAQNLVHNTLAQRWDNIEKILQDAAIEKLEK